MPQKIKTFFQHPVVLSIEILMLVYWMDFAIMEIMQIYEIEFGENENLIEPLIMAILSFPFLYFLIVHPYLRSRRAYTDLLTSQNQTLSEEVEHATRDLKLSEERYALATAGNREGLWDLQLATNELYLSPRFKEILGFTEDDFPNALEAWEHHIHGDDLELFSHQFNLSTQDSLSPTHELEYRIRHKNGTYLWVSCRWLSVLDTQGNISRLVGSQADISDRKQIETQLLHDSLHDALTGLPNRVLLHDRLQQSLLRFQRQPTHGFILLFIDLDNFKHINDSMGHGAGDQLLTEFARRLRLEIRDEDTIARLGGDEFAILITENFNETRLNDLLSRLYTSIHKPLTLNQIELHLNMSIGIVHSNIRHHEQKPEDILAEADMALYHAKENTKGAACVFDTSMRKQIQHNFSLSNALKDAVNKCELMVYYQPVVDARAKKVQAFEALMRWHHPKHGWVSPSHFIPLAEETNLIHDLGHQTMEQVVRDLAFFNNELGHKETVINVNVSARQVERIDLFDRFHQLFVNNNIHPQQICIEITESTVMQNKEKVLYFIEKMKECGSRIAMDDFGTGYSSLGTLYEFPFDILKVDQSFLKTPVLSPSALKMIQLMKTMADTLEMKTVIEGVETPEQLGQLLNIGCHHMQGYLFARPQPKEEILQTIAGVDFFKQPLSTLRSA